MTAAIATCPDCDHARRRAIETGYVYECSCGRTYRARSEGGAR